MYITVFQSINESTNKSQSCSRNHSRGPQFNSTKLCMTVSILFSSPTMRSQKVSLSLHHRFVDKWKEAPPDPRTCVWGHFIPHPLRTSLLFLKQNRSGGRLNTNNLRDLNRTVVSLHSINGSFCDEEAYLLSCWAWHIRVRIHWRRRMSWWKLCGAKRRPELHHTSL